MPTRSTPADCLAVIKRLLSVQASQAQERLRDAALAELEAHIERMQAADEIIAELATLAGQVTPLNTQDQRVLERARRFLQKGAE